MPIPSPHRKHRIPTRLREQTIHVVAHDWGDEKTSRTIVCVHGLTRNGRDFDVFCARLSSEFRLLSFDVPGRGESDWLPTVDDYGIATYVDLLTQALDALSIDRYHWVGTSMGGLIGMGVAVRDPLRLDRLVGNDVGPQIERAAMERIGTYMRTKSSAFDSFEDLFAATRMTIAPFGPLTDEQKRHLVRTSSVCGSDGKWRFNPDCPLEREWIW